MKVVTAPGTIEFGCPAPVFAKFTELILLDVVLHEVTGVGRPVPVSVSEEIVVAEPGLFSARLRLEVAVAAPDAETPPYNVAEASVTVFTLEPKRPKVYAPTTSAKTRVAAIRIIVAMTGVTALDFRLTLSSERFIKYDEICQMYISSEILRRI